MVFDDHIEFLPEPEDPRMLTAIDRDAPGHPVEAYGAEGWEEAPPRLEWLHPFKPPMPWGVFTLAAGLVLLIAFSPAIESLLFGPLVPDSEWAYVQTGIRGLSEQGLSGEGVHVCMVDTGIDLSHPDLRGASIIGYIDLVGGDDSRTMDHGSDHHGTMMAGLLVADGEIRGSAPGVRMSIAAALGMEGAADDERTVADAIRWCWETMQVDVISLSLGGIADPNDPLNSRTVDAVNDALDQGVYVVAASGNDGAGTDDVSTPANVPGVISVGATERDGTIWRDSSSGSLTIGGTEEIRKDPDRKPEISAPGVDIISTADPDAQVPYASSSGTSDSTVFVTGALALILERHGEAIADRHPDSPRSRIDLVKRALMESTIEEGEAPSHDTRLGYGSLSATAWETQVAVALTTG